MLAHLEYLLEAKGHAMVCLAEGAGQEYVTTVCFPRRARRGGEAQGPGSGARRRMPLRPLAAAPAPVRGASRR